MSYVVVTIETENGRKLDLALPLDVPSGALAARVMKQLALTVRPGDGFAFFVRTAGADRRISSDTTLAEAGVSDRQLLLVKKEIAGQDIELRAAPPHLRTDSGDVLPLDGDNVVIGRRDIDMQIMVDVDLSKYDPNNAVSRRHASIGREGTEYYLIDLGSTNGTRLNGRNVPTRQKTPLHDGDLIELGDEAVHVTFVGGRMTPTLPTPG